MTHIFLDESGDLGFNFNNKGTTDFFIVSFLITENKKPIEKIIKNIHKGLRKKYKIRGGVLHAVKEERVTVLRLCRQIIKTDCQIAIIYLDKRRVKTSLRKNSSKIYNQVVNILIDRIIDKNLIDQNQKIEIIASGKETNKFLNQNFKSYLSNRSNKIKVNIKIEAAHQEKSLQAVDMISWSIFRKYEHKDNTFYKILKKKIIEENSIPL